MKNKYLLSLGGAIILCVVLSGCTSSKNISDVNQPIEANAYQEPEGDYSLESSLKKPFDYQSESQKSRNTPVKDGAVVTPDQIH